MERPEFDFTEQNAMNLEAILKCFCWRGRGHLRSDEAPKRNIAPDSYRDDDFGNEVGTQKPRPQPKSTQEIHASKGYF